LASLNLQVIFCTEFWWLAGIKAEVLDLAYHLFVKLQGSERLKALKVRVFIYDTWTISYSLEFN